MKYDKYTIYRVGTLYIRVNPLYILNEHPKYSSEPPVYSEWTP
jgi:hypothetical protein